MFILDLVGYNCRQERPQVQIFHALASPLKEEEETPINLEHKFSFPKSFCILAAYTVMCAVKAQLIKTCWAFYYTLGQLACA